jgi:EAL domain-containing protein (putative c-di-GMP-specific phosphodiesterase class I)
LIRWEHPDRGLVSPSEFVPLAEETGLIIPMGRWVLREACRQARAWEREGAGPPHPVMLANLSANQLHGVDVVQSVEQMLAGAGLDVCRLALDVTETAVLQAEEERGGVLAGLREKGVRISIDDFGTGYSSLAYLKHLPADILKIDKSFVRGLGENAEDTAIVRMVVDLAHTLGMEVIAEGVERADQLTQLVEMGCDMAQGYFFARPLPPEEASRPLASGALAALISGAQPPPPGPCPAHRPL